MSTRGGVAFADGKGGWHGRPIRHDAYPTGAGKEFWRALRERGHTLEHEVLQFNSWEEAKTGGFCGLCGEYAGEPHTISTALQSHATPGPFPDPKCRHHKHAKKLDPYLTNKNTEPLFDEWVYIADFGAGAFVVLHSVLVGFDETKWNSIYGHAQVGIWALGGPEPDWKAVEHEARQLGELGEKHRPKLKTMPFRKKRRGPKHKAQMIELVVWFNDDTTEKFWVDPWVIQSIGLHSVVTRFLTESGYYDRPVGYGPSPEQVLRDAVPRPDIETLLDQLENFFGKVDRSIRTRLRAVVNYPSPETWADTHGIMLSPGVRRSTLWQYVLEVNHDFPRQGPHTEFAWPVVPDQDTLIQALELAAQTNLGRSGNVG